MKKIILAISIITLLLNWSCKNSTSTETKMQKFKLSQTEIQSIADSLSISQDDLTKERALIGVNQLAQLWSDEDGTTEDFKQFCKKYFINDPVKLDSLFMRMDQQLETIFGYFHKIDLKLKEPVQLSNFELQPVDLLIAEMDISSNVYKDLFSNKIAQVCILNFPNFSLEQKTKYGETWTQKQWAYARLGDMFTSRIPSELIQQQSKTMAQADYYISNYNIHMNNLIDSNNNKLFEKDKVLISHWGLRDEIKSNYTDTINGLQKQEIIYQVMKHIINQTIPQEVIDNPKFDWEPFNNKVLSNGVEQKFNTEPDTRYQFLLNNFKNTSALDKYTPNFPTAIDRNFEQTMEISLSDVEKLFKDLLSSSQVKQVADIIKKDLGRDLRPYDIWYDGFKERSKLNQEDLSLITKQKYPNTFALENDLPNILSKLGWDLNRAKEISKLIKVDASTGAGHAWGAVMKNDYAHLRTRIAETGMDYKGFNIAIHEFGHCVEQTITMNEVPYWVLNGVPNNSFTEAAAFLFQGKDLQILNNIKSSPESLNKLALDNFWNSFEIMGVALLDIEIWKWMYQNPNANAHQLKEATINLAKQIWNEYYAEYLGGKDEPILAIYSHMIDYPLYLSYYPLGHIIDFQLGEHFADKQFAKEFERIYSQGRITPQLWMKKAVGSEISIKPLLKAVDKSVEAINSNK